MHSLCNKCNGSARTAGSRCTTHTMDVVPAVMMDVIVDHNIHMRDIQASETSLSGYCKVILYWSSLSASKWPNVPDIYDTM